MKFKFLKTMTISLCMAVCHLANAGLITHNDYTLNTDTNIVTNNVTEWLQWDETIGMSITEALELYAADGWTLAKNEQIASLFMDFGWYSGSDENRAYYHGEQYVAATDNSIMDQFLSLFGQSESITGGDQGFGIGINAFTGIRALYGSDNDGDGYYNSAEVYSDFTSESQNSVFKDGASTYLRNDSHIITTEGKVFGVALVRTVAVPAPSTITILALGIIGLTLRRFKKQSSNL